MRHEKSPLDEIAGEYTVAQAAGDFERRSGALRRDPRASARGVNGRP